MRLIIPVVVSSESGDTKKPGNPVVGNRFEEGGFNQLKKLAIVAPCGKTLTGLTKYHQKQKSTFLYSGALSF